MKAKIQKTDEGLFIYFPDELMSELNWEENDDVLIETTLDCYDDKETTSIIIANLSKVEN